MNDITIRFLAFYNYLLKRGDVNNPSDFAKKISISPSMMNEIIKKRTNAGIRLIQNTVKKYTEINAEWLLTGENNMLKSSYHEIIPKEGTIQTDEEFLNVRGRILCVAHYYKVKKKFFFTELNINYRNFDQEIKEFGLSSDILVKILTKYNEVDTEWLLLGIGNMLKKNNSRSECNIEVMELQRDLIKSLKNENQILQEKIRKFLEDDTCRKDMQKKTS